LKVRPLGLGHGLLTRGSNSSFSNGVQAFSIKPGLVTLDLSFLHQA